MFRKKSIQSEDQRVAHSRYPGSRFTTIVAILLVLLPYSLSFGDDQTTFTLINNTPYFLHAVINGKAYLYIAPYGNVVSDINAYSGATATVTYSPGQNIKGKATREFTVEIQTSSNYSGSRGSDCSNNNRNSDCSSSSSTAASTTTTTTINPISWTVVPSDLQ